MTPLEQEDSEMDSETLQSQIDLSMSLVHDLVSSWVKPTPGGAKQSNYDAQKDLEEYMRRPARLGVGAPIPASSTTSRDAVRLKNHLTDRKKRNHNERDTDEAKAHRSDDEDESRSGVIRKKQKIDPFGEGKKKKKKQSIGLPTPSASQDHESLSSKPGKLANGVGSSKVVANPVPVSSEPIASTGSLTRKQNTHSQTSDSNDAGLKLSSPPLTPARDTAPKIQHSPTTQKDNLPSPGLAEQLLPRADTKASSSGKMAAHQSKAPSVPICGDYSPPKSASTPSTRIFQSPSSARKIPLLNLDGPPPDLSDSEDEQTNPNQTASPKKKRRRRKKKNKSTEQPVTESGEMTTDPIPAA